MVLKFNTVDLIHDIIYQFVEIRIRPNKNNICFSYVKAIKLAGSAQKKKKNRVDRVSGNTGIHLGLSKKK